MGLQYAFDKCKNMKNVMFHIDGIFPFYDLIHRHLINHHFEGIYCLGPVKPVNEAELKRLRSHGEYHIQFKQLILILRAFSTKLVAPGSIASCLWNSRSL